MSDDSNCVKTLEGCKSDGSSSSGTRIPTFNACLPFGASIFSNGTYVGYSAGSPPADGTYTSITISNGCITGVGQTDISTYTSTPCAPVPSGCEGDKSASKGDTKSGGGCSTIISPVAGNLSRLDSACGVLTTISVEAGSGIILSGNGTLSDPLIISANTVPSSSVAIRSGNAAITVTGGGTSANPYTISHIVNGEARNINGMSFDKFGHLIDYSPSSSSGINGILAGSGINVDVTPSTGIATVSLATPLHALKGSYLFGGYTVELDAHNIIYNLSRSINITAGTYTLGDYDVTVNGYGSITNIKKSSSSDDQSSSSVVTTSATKYFAGTMQTASMTFRTAKAANFLVRVHGSIPPNRYHVLVDGVAITIGYYKYVQAPVSEATYSDTIEDIVAFSPAIYAAGQHTVTFSNGTNFSNIVMTVTLTVVV